MKSILLFSIFLICLANVAAESYAPIVLWHGMGDVCCNPVGLGKFKRQLKRALPGVYVHSLMIGNNIKEDFQNSLLMNPNKQIEIACDMIKSNTKLADGYNAIGFSQGSQFLRALAQRCPEPRMKNLTTISGQHQGVYGIPNCDSPSCNSLLPTVTKLAYTNVIQKISTQAAYWHDAINETAYQNGNSFLADVNNEININNSYVENLRALENIIFVKLEDDHTVVPKESQWFGFYKPGQNNEVETLQESRVYNRLGLDRMDQEGKLHFLSTPGDHLQFTWDWFLEHIVERFLK